MTQFSRYCRTFLKRRDFPDMWFSRSMTLDTEQGYFEPGYRFQRPMNVRYNFHPVFCRRAGDSLEFLHRRLSARPKMAQGPKGPQTLLRRHPSLSKDRRRAGRDRPDHERDRQDRYCPYGDVAAASLIDRTERHSHSALRRAEPGGAASRNFIRPFGRAEPFHTSWRRSRGN